MNRLVDLMVTHVEVRSALGGVQVMRVDAYCQLAADQLKGTKVRAVPRKEMIASRVRAMRKP